MAVQQLTEPAYEGSTYPVIVTFRDDTGAAVVPNTASWRLVDTRGTVINSRDSEPISPLASSVTVVLTGNDLAIASSEAIVMRRLTILATYNSSLGNNLAFKSEVEFPITNLAGVG